MHGTDDQLGVVGCEAFSQGANLGPVSLAPVLRIGLGSHLQHELLEAIIDYFLGRSGVIRVIGPELVNQFAALLVSRDGHGQGDSPLRVEPDVGQQRICRLGGRESGQVFGHQVLPQGAVQEPALDLCAVVEVGEGILLFGCDIVEGALHGRRRVERRAVRRDCLGPHAQPRGGDRVFDGIPGPLLQDCAACVRVNRLLRRRPASGQQQVNDGSVEFPAASRQLLIRFLLGQHAVEGQQQWAGRGGAEFMSFFELPDQVLGRWRVLCEPGLDVTVDILGIAQFGEGADPGVLFCAQARGRAVPCLGPRRHHQPPSRRARQ